MNPLINLAIVALQRMSQEDDIIRMRRQIARDGNSLRLMGDDRTLGEHLADAEQAEARRHAAIEHLRSLA